MPDEFHRTSRGRFAPSPTGEVHLGNVWAALLAWLDARQQGGAFVLRIEDLDPERSRPELTDGLLRDLDWLGFDWDEGPDRGGPYAPYEQDRRRSHYAAALTQLEAQGLVYRCYCTRAEVRAAASAPHGQEQREQCPHRCWALSSAEEAVRQARGRQPSIRVRMPVQPTVIEFEDRCYGKVSEDLAQGAGDFVLQRGDGVHAYQLAVVVDDGEMGITDVVRGNDLLPSTARQIWLHRQLGWEPPQYGHVPLLVAPDGQRLSKRHAALAVSALRASGLRPGVLIGHLAQLATLAPPNAEVMPYELVGRLDWTRLPRANIVVAVDALKETLSF